jgi:hypothetical protein
MADRSTKTGIPATKWSLHAQWARPAGQEFLNKNPSPYIPRILQLRVESNYLTLAGLSLEIGHPPPALRTFHRGYRLMDVGFRVSGAGSDKRQRDSEAAADRKMRKFA